MVLHISIEDEDANLSAPDLAVFRVDSNATTGRTESL
jgi:hypothetical protein